MKTEIIRDASGKTIAYQQQVNDYRETITDPSGSLLGWYAPPEERTHAAAGSSATAGTFGPP
ncbi:MAG TPA: hypothetical protein VG146_22250 [Verrucomicrobiae bacterium]|nr:hypothetical protein [Verrucomicrobiae bacterium]